MVTTSYKSFLESPMDVLEFRICEQDSELYTFRKCNKSRATLNKTLETDYRAVFRCVWALNQHNAEWKEDDIDFSGEEFYIVTKRGRVLHYNCSEWSGIGIAPNSR